jgi:Tfp pilus assembly protein PilN
MKPINLLPGEHRPHRGGGKSGSAYVVLGVLAVLLAFVAAYVLSANQVTDRESQTTRAKQEADALGQRSGALSPFGDFAQVKTTRTASVRELAEGRFDWERFMRELALVLPRDGWLRAAEASVTGELTGPAAAAAGTAPAGPAAKITGCTRRQSDVAKLMVRLRELHRVTDVGLKESKRENQASEAGPESCGRYYAFDVTVSFAPAQGDETPEGAKRVPTRLGGGS